MVSLPLCYQLYISSIAGIKLLFVYNQNTQALSFFTNVLYMYM